MLFWLYNLGFPIVFLALLPGYLWRMVRRGDYRARFGQRLAWYSPDILARLQQGPRRIWLQAVSVGETLIALKLLAALRDLAPDRHFILSTTTTTGFRLAEARAGQNVEVIYSPVDLLPVVRRAFRILRPQKLVIVDGGLWPNQLLAARQLKISTILVNARLSPRSEKRFQRFSMLSRQLFRLLDLVCVPERNDLARWTRLGVVPTRINHTGSIKYDDLEPASHAPSHILTTLLDSASIPGARRVLLAGSTHAGEEAIVARAYLDLRRKHPDLFLIIAPRHVERTPAIIEELSSANLRILRRTSLANDVTSSTLPAIPAATVAPDILLLDTTGELREWYQLATLVFIGKSLSATGGHNPAEAISHGKPVLVGPHMENFQDLTDELLAEEAIIQIHAASDLASACASLLDDPGRGLRISQRARAVLEKHRGAAVRSAELVLAGRQLSTC